MLKEESNWLSPESRQPKEMKSNKDHAVYSGRNCKTEGLTTPRSSKPPFPDSIDAVVFQIEASQRCALRQQCVLQNSLPQHRREDLAPGGLFPLHAFGLMLHGDTCFICVCLAERQDPRDAGGLAAEHRYLRLRVCDPLPCLHRKWRVASLCAWSSTSAKQRDFGRRGCLFLALHVRMSMPATFGSSGDDEEPRETHMKEMMSRNNEI